MTASTFRPQVAGEYPDATNTAPAPLRLYEYADALLAVRADLLDSEDGELTPDMERALDGAVADFGQKVEQVAFVIRELKAEAKAINDEAERIAQRARRRDKAAARLTAYLQGQLERADVPKVERPLVTVRLQRNSAPTVRHAFTPEQVTDLYLDEGWRPFVRVIPQTCQLDTQAVVAAWKQKQPIPEGVEVVVGHHVRIA